MSITATPIKAVVVEDTTTSFLARLVRDDPPDVAYVVQEDLASVSYKVFAGRAEVADDSLDISDVVYDTLQTGTLWTPDSTGYNFLAKLPAGHFANPGAHAVEFLFTLDGGDVFFLRYVLDVKPVITS